MQKKWIWFVPAAILGGIVFMAFGGFAVQWLWNWLLPPLFGWHLVTFWQALGMLLLCRILFGGLGRHGGGKHRWGGERRDRKGDCDSRTPEERQQMREQFRERLRKRWGGHQPGHQPGPPPSTEPKTP